ncbi:hypothetical protein N4Q68_29335, partial [Salmonella enterica subsp. enterica serovar Montevideo]
MKQQEDSVDSDVGRNQPEMVVAVHIDAGDFVKVKGQVFEVEETDFDDHDVTLWFVGGNALKCAAGCPVEVVSAPVAAGIKVKGGSEMATNEILPVTRIGRADGDYGCYCPHCGNPMFFSESELDDIRGSQYQHTRIISLLTGERCEGWLEVSTNASFSRILFDQRPRGGLTHDHYYQEAA